MVQYVRDVYVPETSSSKFPKPNDSSLTSPIETQYSSRSYSLGAKKGTNNPVEKREKAE